MTEVLHSSQKVMSDRELGRFYGFRCGWRVGLWGTGIVCVGGGMSILPVWMLLFAIGMDRPSSIGPIIFPALFALAMCIITVCISFAFLIDRMKAVVRSVLREMMKSYRKPENPKKFTDVAVLYYTLITLLVFFAISLTVGQIFFQLAMAMFGIYLIVAVAALVFLFGLHVVYFYRNTYSSLNTEAYLKAEEIADIYQPAKNAMGFAKQAALLGIPAAIAANMSSKDSSPPVRTDGKVPFALSSDIAAIVSVIAALVIVQVFLKVPLKYATMFMFALHVQPLIVGIILLAFIILVGRFVFVLSCKKLPRRFAKLITFLVVLQLLLGGWKGWQRSLMQSSKSMEDRGNLERLVR